MIDRILHRFRFLLLGLVLVLVACETMQPPDGRPSVARRDLLLDGDHPKSPLAAWGYLIFPEIPTRGDEHWDLYLEMCGYFKKLIPPMQAIDRKRVTDYNYMVTFFPVKDVKPRAADSCEIWLSSYDSSFALDLLVHLKQQTGLDPTGPMLIASHHPLCLGCEIEPGEDLLVFDFGPVVAAHNRKELFKAWDDHITDPRTWKWQDKLTTLRQTVPAVIKAQFKEIFKLAKRGKEMLEEKT